MTGEIHTLNGLPPNAVIKWNKLYKDTTLHVGDEDIVYIDLGNSIKIDAGQYSELGFFRVAVINAKLGNWSSIESSISLNTHDVAVDIVRLAKKYSDQRFVEIAGLFDQ